MGGATHIPLKASDGDPFGGAGAGDAHKVAAADVAGKQWRSNLWWDDGYHCCDVTKGVVCIVKVLTGSFDPFYGFMCADD